MHVLGVRITAKIPDTYRKHYMYVVQLCQLIGMSCDVISHDIKQFVAE